MSAALPAEDDASLAVRLQLYELSRTRPSRRTAPSPFRMKALHLERSLAWSAVWDVVVLLMLALLYATESAFVLGLAFAGLAAPAAGIAAVRLRKVALACLHTILSASNVVVRVYVAPGATRNFLLGAAAVALSLPGLHVTRLAVLWLRLLWRHGARINRQREQHPRGRSTHGEHGDDFGDIPLGVPVTSSSHLPEIAVGSEARAWPGAIPMTSVSPT